MGRPKKKLQDDKKEKKNKSAAASKNDNDEVEIIEDDDQEDEEDCDADRKNKKLSKEVNDQDVEVGSKLNSLMSKSNKTAAKILVSHKGILEIGWENIEQVIINHPKTEQKCVFLIDTRLPEDDKERPSTDPFIFEVMTMEQDTRSWFIGEDSVVSDGNIYVCTPMDPLFFVLPALMKTTRAMPLKDHLMETIKDQKVINVIAAHLSDSTQLENISKKIVCDDIIAFKFLEEKTLDWLTSKVKKTAEFLKERDITGSEASVSSNFTKSSSILSTEKKQEEYRRYACEIVGEYLPDSLRTKLFENLGLPFVQEKVSKRKCELETSDLAHTKKFKVADVNGKTETVQPTEDYGTSAPSNISSMSSKMKSKDKELQKAAKGTQSLFKFFAAKPK